jgi:hypothetical protein
MGQRKLLIWVREPMERMTTEAFLFLQVLLMVLHR